MSVCETRAENVFVLTTFLNTQVLRLEIDINRK